MKKFLLPQRRLGKTGRMVTPLGFGAAWIGWIEDDDVAIQTTLRALDHGINLIDTSPLYGESERRLGQALTHWHALGGKRADIFLSTKTGTRSRPYDYSYGGTLRSVEMSLELLKTDYFDIVHIHDPEDLAPVLEPHGALAALKHLKSEGVIKAIGLGVRTHAFLRRMIESDEIDACVTFRDFNLLYQTAADAVLAPAAAHDVGVLNGMAVMYGLLGGEDPLEVARKRGGAFVERPPDRKEAGEVRRARALWEFANKHGINLLALNLQYCLREPRICATLVGAETPAQIDADVKAVTERIPENVWEELAMIH